VPHQPGEDGRGSLRPSTRGAREPLQALTVPGAPTPDRGDGSTTKLFVVTGPSGAGKGTLIRELLARRDDLELAISATTRPRRPGEQDGREYYFLEEADFDRRVAAGEFLEHVVYVSGQRYGTLRSEVERILSAGRSCILELETQGAKAVAAALPANGSRGTVTIFIAPPGVVELERRLRERATESAGEIGERIELAHRQMAEASDFDHVVLNDELARAVGELERVIEVELGVAATLAVDESA
jgi:guanylate kinase